MVNLLNGIKIMAEEVKSGFVAHLIELRDRLIKSLLSILVIFIAIVCILQTTFIHLLQRH